MFIIVVISNETVDQEPSLKELAQEIIHSDEFIKEEYTEPVNHNWPIPITILKREAHFGRSVVLRVHTICGRYPSGHV